MPPDVLCPVRSQRDERLRIDRAGNLRTYRPLAHQHAPEIEDALRAAGAPADQRVHFVPVSAPLVRGILATSFARVPPDATDEDLGNAFDGAYREEPFVRVPRVRLPEVVAVAGSSFAEVAIVRGPVEGHSRLVTCFGALDNLVKGGAGQVIQCMNLMLDLPETAGLGARGAFP
jgi:N-acetyl-gamma-glutamyl-phosphate reductase